MVVRGVKGEMERLLRQARVCLAMKGQFVVANLKRFSYLDLSCSCSKAEFMKRVHNHADSLRSCCICPY